MNPTISMLFLGKWISLFELLLMPIVEARNEEKCYSCSSANFAHRWPKDKNSTLLYLRNFAMVSNDSCDDIRSALPVVECPNSVCVKFVVQESISNRAVCSSALNPIIVRDCWSRVLESDDPSLQFNPYTTKPVKLAPLPGQERTIGQVYTCQGYLCNGSNKVQISHLLITSLFCIFGLLNKLI
ncbi:hypothetical protein M3Y97_00053500 [Aphelenchoides bicaudatus]|nr:hypothetical protein M3Y97_00053500 [Aphelenchoides bicaudatus]